MYSCSETATITKKLWAVVTVKFSKNLLHCKYPIHSVLNCTAVLVLLSPEMSWIFGSFICMYVFVFVWCKSVKMLLDVFASIKLRFFSFELFGKKNVYSHSCYSDFFPVARTLFENRSIWRKTAVFLELGVGWWRVRERKTFCIKKDWKPPLKTRLKLENKPLAGSSQTPTLSRWYFLWRLGWLVLPFVLIWLVFSPFVS